MNNPDGLPEQAAERRKQAEAVARETEPLSLEQLEALSPEETRHMLHELRVHQIELEMQNEELRTVQAELDAARGRYFALYDLAPVGYCTVSEQGLILEANLTAARLLGETGDALVKQPITRFILPDDQDIYYRYRRLLFATGEPQVRELRMVKMDGTAFWANLEAIVAPDADGTPTCRVVLSDITESKAAEERERGLERQLQQGQKLESLGVLAGGIAHDFNNILMAVLGHAELALAELGPASPARTDVLEITRASQRAAALCRQMLAYSGRGRFSIESVELGDLVADMVELLRTTLSKKIVLNLRLEQGLPSIRGDSTQLSQVIMNLVINASEAIGDRSGIITIHTGAQECSTDYLCETYVDPGLSEGFFVTLEVSDTGCGMDTQTQQRLFEPFFTTKFTGRGLGLSAALGIVRGHQGALKVYSEPGKGSTFKLLFPAAEVEAGASREAGREGTEKWMGAGTVLLVDDEETIRAVGKRMLERLGFLVLTATDGLGALDVFRAHEDEIDFVLLDLTMPHMDGEEAYRELRRIDPHVRVVLSSGYTESDLASRFMGKGLLGFIQKPYTLAELRDRLRAALDADGAMPGDTAD
jgi:two-component system, cell cycle sensor histidine kinase and response regulator CckA